jgi:hypothetical protein
MDCQKHNHHQVRSGKVVRIPARGQFIYSIDSVSNQVYKLQLLQSGVGTNQNSEDPGYIASLASFV